MAPGENQDLPEVSLTDEELEELTRPDTEGDKTLSDAFTEALGEKENAPVTKADILKAGEDLVADEEPELVSITSDQTTRGAALSDEKEVQQGENPLIVHAKRELELVGVEPEVSEGIIQIVEIFAAQGHSGASAMITSDIIGKLLKFENLLPLTDDPEEWFDHGPTGPRQVNLYQNKRNGAAFSTDGGKSYTLTSEQGPGGYPGPTYLSVKRETNNGPDPVSGV